MRLASIHYEGKEIAAVITDQGVLPIKFLNKNSFGVTLLELIKNEQLKKLQIWWEKDGIRNRNTWANYLIPWDEVKYAPLYRHPSKIWGIGLNYMEHAKDLDESVPSVEPASFMKPTTSIIGYGDDINIPKQSHRTTAEAELGVIIGKVCKEIEEEEVEEYIAGYTSIIDMTAEDILRENPRYLTRAKSFDTFFSFGPHLITANEVKSLDGLSVATVINGKIHRKNYISMMTFPPHMLVAFHSQVMTLLPGDIISTGTPGAVVIRDGDVVECRIEGFPSLVNAVKDLKG